MPENTGASWLIISPAAIMEKKFKKTPDKPFA
jgi:hypothetical protein